VQKPTISETGNGYYVTGIAIHNTFSVDLCNTTMRATENYITPNTTGVALGNTDYNLAVGVPVNITGTQCTMELENVSYLPILQTVSLLFTQNRSMYYTVSGKDQQFNASLSAGIPAMINYPDADAKMVIRTDEQHIITAGFTIYNATSTSLSAPRNYTKLVALNITTNTTQISSITLTLGYSCGLSGVTYPFILNGTTAWSRVENFSRNSSTCSVSFVVPGDPVVALMEQHSSVKASPISKVTTTLTTTIPLSTTTVPQNAIPNGDYSLMLEIAVIIVVVLVVIVLLMGGRMRPPAQPVSVNQQPVNRPAPGPQTVGPQQPKDGPQSVPDMPAPETDPKIGDGMGGTSGQTG
jgi:hypothetical protein